MPQRTSRRSELAPGAYAHAANDAGAWHGLAERIGAVAEQFVQCPDAFGASGLGYWHGIWHDFATFNSEFQRYPRGHGGSVDNKRVGAQLAQDTGLLALAFQWHHGGLQSPADDLNWLEEHGRRDGSLRRLIRCLPPCLSSLAASEAQRYRDQSFLPLAEPPATPAWSGTPHPARGLLAAGGEPEDYMV